MFGGSHIEIAALKSNRRLLQEVDGQVLSLRQVWLHLAQQSHFCQVQVMELTILELIRHLEKLILHCTVGHFLN